MNVKKTTWWKTYLQAETEATFFAVNLLLCGAGDVCGAIRDVNKGKHKDDSLNIWTSAQVYIKFDHEAQWGFMEKSFRSGDSRLLKSATPLALSSSGKI